jgi:serralysin
MSSADTIKDFRRGSDHIDLRAIDANTKVAGDQAFAFIGKTAFHGKAGELRFADGIVSGDTNGDKIADFGITVAGLSAMSKGDFYL